jgi:flavodoxin
MNILILYFSYSGNCDFVAQQIKAQTSATLLRLELQDEKKHTGFLKYLWGGRMVMMNKKPALKPFTIDVNQYDLIIIGTPVWAGSPSPVFRSFFEQQPVTGKKIALFCCYAGNYGKTFATLKSTLPGNEFVGEIDFANPSTQKAPEFSKRLKDWLASLSIKHSPHA